MQLKACASFGFIAHHSVVAEKVFESHWRQLSSGRPGEIDSQVTQLMPRSVFFHEFGRTNLYTNDWWIRSWVGLESHQSPHCIHRTQPSSSKIPSYFIVLVQLQHRISLVGLLQSYSDFRRSLEQVFV